MSSTGRPGMLQVSGSIRVPGDKSISHRALILAALAPGVSRVSNILNSADVRATAGALNALGARIPDLCDSLSIQGVHPDGLHTSVTPLDCGNSGTTTRLMMGVVAALNGRSARFEGDQSLNRRPMRRVTEPLIALGARVELHGEANHYGLPLTVRGASLQPITWHNEHSSAQVKSAVLLAALLAGVEATLQEPHQSRDHTERMLAARGVHLEIAAGKVRLLSHQTMTPLDVDVPADPSSAMFLAALAALANSGQLRLTDVCLNSSRIAGLHALREMGASLHFEDERTVGGELVGTVVIRPDRLVAIQIGGERVPSLIDELPMIACVAARAEGETRVTGASELRVKESDRITAVVENLRAIGADADELPDGFVVRGHERALAGTVTTHGDHRLAMAFGILGAIPGNTIVIDNPHCVDVSFPSFWQELHGATGTRVQSTVTAAASR